MITASIDLYILIFNKKSLSFDILSLDKDYLKLPSRIVEENVDIDSIICSLFENYVDISFSYAKYKLCDAYNTNILNLSYLILLPFGTTIKNSYLLPSKKYEYKPNLQKIIKSL